MLPIGNNHILPNNKALRQSWELFKQVRVGEYGTDIVWSDDLDMSADTLWRLAHEQSGRTITAEAFRSIS